MGQIIKTKDLVNTKLANNYGGWIYCNSCNQTIGYLCYITYCCFTMEYICKCGNNGSMKIKMEDKMEPIPSTKALTRIKNRLCCPEDQSPLITILNKKLNYFSYKIVCNNCNHEYCE